MPPVDKHFLEVCRSLKITPRSVINKLRAVWLAQVTQDLVAERVLHECRVARPKKRKTGRKQTDMAINRRGRPAGCTRATETAVDPLADTTPSNNPLAGLGLGDVPTPTVSTEVPMPAAPNPLAGLMGTSTLTEAPPIPVAGLAALRGSVDAAVVKASLGLTGGTGPDPIILQALQDIQVKLGKLDTSYTPDARLTAMEKSINKQVAAESSTLIGRLILIEKAVMAMGDVLKEVHTMLMEATAEESLTPAETPKTVAAPATSSKPAGPSMLSIEITQALLPMLQEQRKAVPAFALNWKNQAATIFPALAQAVSQKLGKEVSDGAVKFALREFDKLNEATGLIDF